MFKCEKCKKTSQPGEPSRRMVVETRQKSYPTGGAIGWEIVRELVVCDPCSSAGQTNR